MKGLSLKTLSNAKSAQVIVRFALRMIIICTFAVIAGADVTKNLATLLLLSTGLCVIGGLVRREKLFDVSLTYWDEAAVYGLLFGVTSIIAGA